MSHLTPYPHVVTVTTKKAVRDDAGSPEAVPDKTYTVPCKIQPLSSQELITHGLGTVTRTTVKLLCDAWPGGLKSDVVWNGRKFSQPSEASTYDAGYFTKGVTVILQANDAEFK